MARIIGDQQPDWVVVENVARGWKRWLPHVRSDLRRLGYRASLPIPLEARVSGAPHVRQRIFLVAHADGQPLRVEQQRVTGGRSRGLRQEGQAKPLGHGSHAGWDAQPPMADLGHGLPAGVGASVWRALGNAVVPQCAETVGWVIRELIDAGVDPAGEFV
jgi:site-specific DNA-cytosine methylase